MIKLKRTTKGYLIPVLVSAGSSQNAVRGQHDGRMKLAVSAPPEKGKANKAITQLLARELDISKSRIHVVSGKKSPEKKILVERVPASALDAILPRS
ncbi:MAG: DUF167 domain-containing protein [Planctomycetota bacterium]